MLLKDEVDVFVVIGAGDDVVLIFIFKKKKKKKTKVHKELNVDEVVKKKWKT